MRRVDLGERRMLGALRTTSGHKRLVNAPCLFNGAEAAQGVRHDDGAGLQVTPGPGPDLVASKPTDPAQAHLHRPALSVEFHGGHERLREGHVEELRLLRELVTMDSFLIRKHGRLRVGGTGRRVLIGCA